MTHEPELGYCSAMTFGLYHSATLVIHESAMVQSAMPFNESDLLRYEVYQRCLRLYSGVAGPLLFDAF